MASETVYRYRRRGDACWQWEPLIVASSWFYARQAAKVILQCEDPVVEDSGRAPPLPDVVPPPAVPKPRRRQAKPRKKK